MNEFVYGTIGGMTGIIISHPFDTIKTRLQSQHAPSFLDAVKQKKLYSGITTPLLGVMLEKSIVFGCYDYAKQNGYHPFYSGLFGGFMSTLIVTPVDRIKINIQNQTPIPWKSLYRGFIPTLCRETPGFGIYFTTYQYLSRYNKEQNSFKYFLFGSLSGFMAWLFIYPSDFIKTRIQSTKHISIGSVIKDIWNEQNPTQNKRIGFCNFYKGFSLAMLRALPLHGGVFLGYELSKRHLNYNIKN